jgi:hypothetical protein
MADALRIVQWTTGNVGQRTVRAVLAHPDMDLVGCYAWSAGKAGQDVASLCALDSPTGVTATNDVAALLALRPDCVIYNPKWCNPEELSKILESGANVVTTAGFITGHALGADRARLAEACAKGGTTLFGSGMNPGLANLLGIVSGQLCDRIDSISVLESVDSTGYDSPETELLVGFGKPIDHPGLQEMTASGTAVFSDAVHLMADAFRIELDEVRCLVEYAQTTEDLDLGSWSIAAGCVAQRPDARARLADRARLRRGHPRTALCAHQDRGLPRRGLRSQLVQGLHGHRDDHDGDASRQRHSRCRCRSRRHRHLQRPASDRPVGSGHRRVMITGVRVLGSRLSIHLPHYSPRFGPTDQTSWTRDPV